MNPPTDIERKVRQLDEDILTIYDMLGTIKETQQQHSQLLHTVGQHLGDMNTRIDGIDTRLDGMDSKLDDVLDLLRPRDDR
jgi:hypothetical protein